MQLDRCIGVDRWVMTPLVDRLGLVELIHLSPLVDRSPLKPVLQLSDGQKTQHNMNLAG